MYVCVCMGGEDAVVVKTVCPFGKRGRDGGSTRECSMGGREGEANERYKAQRREA